MNPLFRLRYSESHDAFLIGPYRSRIMIAVTHRLGFYGLQFKVPFHFRADILRMISERMR